MCLLTDPHVKVSLMCHAHCDVSVARSLMCHRDDDVSVARSLREGVPDVSGETHQKEEDVGAEEHPAPGLQRGPGL